MKKAKANNSSIRQKILDAASKIMNQKGFTKSNISEISLKAGVKDPVIYQYFSGKQDLLFSIVEDHMEKFLSFLDDQLQGINGVYNKFRKLVWAHLRYNDVNREYITLVNLECRSNPNFYKTGAYKLIRCYSRILLRILNEGVENKVFRSDINLTLVRDIIFGLVDFEAITCLITKEIPEAAPDHEGCMILLERILLANLEYERTSSKEKKRKILNAGIRMFAEKGYSATISEIANKADVADGTVYEYFKNKEELLLSIPEERFEEHLSELREAFSLRDPVRKIQHFIKNHFNIFLIDMDFLRVYLILILLNRRFYESRAYQSLQRYIQVLEQLVQDGIEDGSFAENTSVRLFRNMFLGAFTHMVLRWLFASNRVTVDKLEEINNISNLLTDALVNKKSEQA